jgi:hypothetical protein
MVQVLLHRSYNEQTGWSQTMILRQLCIFRCMDSTRFSKSKAYDAPNEKCDCKLCDSECGRYNITDCKQRSNLLTVYAEEN